MRCFIPIATALLAACVAAAPIAKRTDVKRQLLGGLGSEVGGLVGGLERTLDTLGTDLFFTVDATVETVGNDVVAPVLEGTLGTLGEVL